jgi:MFS family permease
MEPRDERAFPAKKSEAEHHSAGRLWSNRDFLLLWSGQAVSTLGTYISNFALPLLVLALTHSPAQAGIIAAVQICPYAVLSLPAGVLVDRWDRKKLMMVCDTLRVLAYGSIPLAYLFGQITLAQLYLVALVGGTAFVFFNIAQIASLPRVVSLEHVSQANGVNAATESGAQLLGPGIGGLIIGLAKMTIRGTALAYFVDSCSYAVSVVSLFWTRTPFQEKRTVKPGVALQTQLADGIRFVWKHQLLRLMALLTFFIYFFVTPSYLAVIVLGSGPLHMDVRTLGLVLSTGSAGGILGSVLAPWVAAHVRYGRLILGTVFAQVLALLLLALSVSPLLLVGGYGLLSLSMPVQTVTLISYRLSVTPDALQGRVNSFARLFIFGGNALGLVVSGWLLGFIGPYHDLWLMTIGMGICAVAFSLTAVRQA